MEGCQRTKAWISDLLRSHYFVSFDGDEYSVQCTLWLRFTKSTYWRQSDVGMSIFFNSLLTASLNEAELYE